MICQVENFRAELQHRGNAGQIFSTVSSSRQIQFGLRLSF
jgi:hypothetical protein